MKIVNFNRHKKNGILQDTYIAWTKQYLYALNAKITSLQDYLVYNNPEYIIFNSPNRQAIDIIELGIQKDYDDEELSLFFPAKLGFHQGFYNQSKHGDGVLVYQPSSSCLPTTYYYTPRSSCIYHTAKYNAKNNIWEIFPLVSTDPDRDIDNYIFYLTDTGDSIEDDTVIRWEIDEETGALTFNEVGASEKAKYYLVHKSQKEDYGARQHWCYDDEDKIWKKVFYIPQGIVDFDLEDKDVATDWYVHTVATGRYIYTNETESESLTEIKNLMSGFVCIANKQPVGTNNEYSNLKHSLDYFLIAPVGNGAYYHFNFHGNNLQATYQANDLGNFADKVRINLGQNLRFVDPDDFFIKGVDAKGNNGALAIQNIIVSKSGVTDNITDHVGNLWTGGKELVGQSIFVNTGEEIFMDICYDTYITQIGRNIVHSFNLTTPAEVVEFGESEESQRTMIKLQLF